MAQTAHHLNHCDHSGGNHRHGGRRSSTAQTSASKVQGERGKTIEEYSNVGQ